MKTKLIASLLLFFVGILNFAQSIKFISANSQEPLSKVVVFNKNGDILTTSDIEGKILKVDLLPIQESYILVYDNYTIGHLKSDDLNFEVIKLNDRLKDIEEVVIKKSGKTKYMFLRGNFNVYMTLDKKLNVYADGIATYVFDNQTKKLKNIKIEQYRTFAKSKEGADKKNVGTLVFESFLEVPELKGIEKLNEYKNNPKTKYKEIITDNQIKMQYEDALLQEKAVSLFGYRFYDFKYFNNAAFTKNTLQLRDFTHFNEILNIKLKHKSESDYHQLTKYANFYTTEISFGNDDKLPKIKLDASKSFYHYDYWKANGFPNMQPVFSSFFKDSLQEKKNFAKK